MVLVMNRKKVILPLSLLFILVLFSSFAVAQEDDALSGLSKSIAKWFGFIPEMVTLEKLIANDALALFYAKFLIWVLLFAVLYFGAGFVFPEQKRIRIVVALVIALMGTLLIPNVIIINIFQTYSLAAGLAVWFVPVVIGLYLAYKIENRAIKVVFYLLLTIILLNIDKTINIAYRTQGNAGGAEWYEFFRLLLFVVVVAFIWNLGAMVFGGRAGSVGGAIGSKLGNIANWATRKGEKPAEEAAEVEETEKTVEKREIRDEKKIVKILKDLEKKFNDLIKGRKEQKDFIDIEKDLRKLNVEVQNLAKLEGIEYTIENLKRHKGIGIRGKLEALLKKESDLLKAFNILVREGVALIRTDFPRAKEYIKEARMIMKVLIKINRKEKRQL